MYGRKTNFTFRWVDSFWQKLDFANVPPRKDRSLCQYLVEESTFDGLSAYARMAMIWFRDLVSSHRYGTTRADADRTLFVCFSELEKSQIAIMDHFFPGGHEFTRVDRLPPADVYEGGHSTSRNDELRRELKDLLIAIDDMFNLRELQKMNEELGCVNH